MKIVNQIKAMVDKYEKIAEAVHTRVVAEDDITREEVEDGIIACVKVLELNKHLYTAILEFRSFRFGERDDVKMGPWPKVGKKQRVQITLFRKMRLRTGPYGDPNWELTEEYLLGSK